MRALFQYQRGAHAGGQDVFYQVRQVNGLPNFAGLGARLLIIHIRIGGEVRIRPAEFGIAQREEAIDVPLLNIVRAGIDVDGEIKEIRNGEGGAGLKDVEALKIRISGWLTSW